MQNKSLAEIYSSKTDDELVALAADADALVDDARLVLADEFLRRNITVANPSMTDRSTPQRDSRVSKLLRYVGTFALNLAIATFGTAFVESPIWSAWSGMIGRAHSVSGIEAREWFLSLTIATLLGVFIGRRWSTVAVWVWTLPVAWFALGVFAYSVRPKPSILVGGGFAEHFFLPNCGSDPHLCRDFFWFTLPVARTLVYSLGTWVSSHFHVPTGFKSSQPQA